MSIRTVDEEHIRIFRTEDDSSSDLAPEFVAYLLSIVEIIFKTDEQSSTWINSPQTATFKLNMDDIYGLWTNGPNNNGKKQLGWRSKVGVLYPFDVVFPQ